MRAIVLGGGSWGLAFTKLLRDNGISVALWEYNQDYALRLKEERANTLLLPGVVLDEAVFISNSLDEIMAFEAEIMVFAVPSHAVRMVASEVSKTACNWKQYQAVVNLAKGLELKSLKWMSQVLQEELPLSLTNIITTLSGPSHAEEVARKIPTAVVLAGYNPDTLNWVQETISNQYFRVYTSYDLIGVEIGGAVKNIIAIASGIVDGLGMGDNTKGALLTRGMTEIKRLGIALDADPNTLYGLSGIGDLITTAISRHSRNRYVGYELGKGKKLNEIISSMAMVAEGVKTTESIYELKNKLKVSMPITEQIYQVLFKDKAPMDAISDLMLRDLKEED